MAGKGNPLWVKGGPSPNPSGRKPLTPEQLQARDIRNRAQPAIMAFLVRTALDATQDMRDRIACAKIVVDPIPTELEITTDSPGWTEEISNDEAIEIIRKLKDGHG